MRIVTLCGSLRSQSSNRAILRAYERVTAPTRTKMTHYERLEFLPHFNPDLDGESVSVEVMRLRDSIREADAVVISTPEYAHALPGSFKNALDWLVSDPAFSGKPVVLLHADRSSSWALDSLREVLATMSARIIEPASVLLPLGNNKLTADEILARADLQRALENSFAALCRDFSGKPVGPIR